MPIPKKLHQVWIGPLPPPKKWMDSWKNMNPEWEYILWDNKKVFSRKWKNQHLIDYALAQYKKGKGAGANGEDIFTSARGAVFTGEKATLFAWHVIADIIRYEILYEYGGYMPGADSRCLKPIDRVNPFADCDLYTLSTGHLFEKHRARIKEKYPNGKPKGRDRLLWRRYAPNNASPILASSKHNEFLLHCIEELSKLKKVGEAVDDTGNVFMGRMLKKYPPKNALIKPYILRKSRIGRGFHSIHYAGTTKNTYHLGR